MTDKSVRPTTDRSVRPTALAFSMRDLALREDVLALREAGVAGLKIEGRMKGPLYVAATTDFYRQLLDGRLTPGEQAYRENDLQTIFARPWTKLYLRSREQGGAVETETAGPLGAHIGTVEAVVRHGPGTPWVRFKTARPLRVRDGLQLTARGQARPFGFSIRRLRVAGEGGAPTHSTFAAPGGAAVEVALPEGYATVPVGSAVHCSSSQDVKERYRFTRPKPGQYRVRRQMDVEVFLTAAGLEAAAHAVPARAVGESIEARCVLKADLPRVSDPAQLTAAVQATFGQLGGQPFTLGNCTLHNADGRFAPLSLLKQARRALVEELRRSAEAALVEKVKRVVEDEAVTAAEALAAAPRHHLRPPRPPCEPVPRAGFRWLLKVDRLSHLAAFEESDWRAVDELIVEVGGTPTPRLSEALEGLAARVGRERIRLALPLVARAWEEAELTRRINSLRSSGWTKWEAANLTAWTYLGLTADMPSTEPIDLTADWTLYALNSAAIRELRELGAHRVTLSVEDGLANWRELLREWDGKVGVVVNQDTPLLISESCVWANLEGGCKRGTGCAFRDTGEAGSAGDAGRRLRLRSSYGQELLAVDRGCRTVVLSDKTFCLSPFLRDLAAASAAVLRVDLVYRSYTPEEARGRWRAVRAGEALPATHTANFWRNLM